MVNEFDSKFKAKLQFLEKMLSIDNGEWVAKGFIDYLKRIYPIPNDTKVISKLVELILFPFIAEFATENGYELKLSKHQNHYPDLSIILDKKTKVALDIKSTYRKSEQQVSGFTLGTFTGYFQKRDAQTGITFPYNEYDRHYVLGVIYSRVDKSLIPVETKTYSIGELGAIPSVINNIRLVFHEKWQLASDKPGSGNTKNIGSEKNIEKLIEGRGPFAAHGVKVFDDYWLNYLNKEMADKVDRIQPYKNLIEYLEWKKR